MPNGRVGFRHVAMFRWRADAQNDDRLRAVAGMRELPLEIAAIQTIVVAEDAGVNIDNFDACVIVDFLDEAGYLVYRDHPAHRRLIDEQVKPILENRSALQYEVI